MNSVIATKERNTSSGQSQEEKARLAISRARSALIMEHPFFGDIALRLRLKADTSCHDLWTDGRTFGFNPKFVLPLSEKSLIGAVAHEVMHIACGHTLRRKGRDETLWNEACDLAVNGLLQEAGFTLPEGALLDPQYNDMSVDEIYAVLFTRQRDDAISSEGTSNSPGEEQASVAFAGKSGLEENGQPAEPCQKAGTEQKETQQSEAGANKGLAKDGSDQSANNPAQKATGFSGEVRDIPLEGEGQRSEEEAQVENEASITRALQRALNMGNAPGWLSRIIQQKATSELGWRDILAQFLERCSGGDYTWITPNKRYIQHDIYLPSLEAPQIPQIALAIDSSGSVGESLLSAFCVELSAILEAYDTTIQVIYHDTQAHDAGVFGRMDLPLQLNPFGGGGTDYRPVTEFINERGDSPAALIWFTDFECNRFPEEPSYPVLWVTGCRKAEQPPFGQVLYMNP